MKLSRLPALVAMLAMGICTGTAQTNGPVLQNTSRTSPGNSPRANNARPNNSNLPYVPRGPANAGQRPSNIPPVQIQNRPPANFRPNDGPVVQQLDPRLVPRQRAPFLRVQPRPSMLAKNDITENRLPVPQAPPIARNAQSDLTPQEGTAESPITRETRKSIQRDKRDNKEPRLTYFDALRTHRHEWHNRDWWKQHCNTIVFVIGGYYFLDAGYWYPAWGYDPYNSYYDYDGPIYTYGNLLPDQVIANVQAALQDAGYYYGAVTGSLNVETRSALVNFQRDQGLIVSGAVDEPTVEALGLY